MGTPTGNVDLRSLFTSLCELTAYAASAGMAPERLAAATDVLMAGVMELRALRLGAQDPRRARSLSVAYSVLRALETGASIDQCQQRFRRSRSQIYRLREVARHHATVFGNDESPKAARV